MVKQKIRVIFSKTGDMKFISHLDLVRLFHRSARRARLPIEITKGFSPRLKINIIRALKLGVESQGEEAVFYMERPMAPQDMGLYINKKLPEGVRVEKCEEIL